MGSQPITFAFNSENSESLLKTEHITPVEEKLAKIDKFVELLQTSNQFAQLTKETQLKNFASINKNNFWLVLLYSLGLLGVTVWQVYIIKKLQDNRKVL